jgi:hypothetical protein
MVDGKAAVSTVLIAQVARDLEAAAVVFGNARVNFDGRLTTTPFPRPPWG